MMTIQNDRNDIELKRKLSHVATPQEFENIFSQERVRFPGSPRRCVETLAKLVPPEKQHIAEKAIETIRKRFSSSTWNYAGD